MEVKIPAGISGLVMTNFKARVKTMTNQRWECFRCYKFGHYACECYPRLSNDKGKEVTANFVEDKEVETLLTKMETHLNQICGMLI